MEPSFIIMLVAMLTIMYFFIIRPSQKKMRDEKLFVSTLQKGSKVVTHGGIHGRIVSIDESSNTLMVEIDTNVKIKLDRSAISSELTKAKYNEQAKQS